MVAIRDASYIFQSILVKDNILAYFSFFLIIPMKRVCPFTGYIHFYIYFTMHLLLAWLVYYLLVNLITIYSSPWQVIVMCHRA